MRLVLLRWTCALAYDKRVGHSLNPETTEFYQVIEIGTTARIRSPNEMHQLRRHGLIM
jgi:hypothetical protein